LNPATPAIAPISRPRQVWSLADPHSEQAAALAKGARIPTVLAELLIARGIASPSDKLVRQGRREVPV